jgi:hypothetical protein
LKLIDFSGFAYLSFSWWLFLKKKASGRLPTALGDLISSKIFGENCRSIFGPARRCRNIHPGWLFISRTSVSSWQNFFSNAENRWPEVNHYRSVPYSF